MSQDLSRRDFIKLMGTALALGPLLRLPPPGVDPYPEIEAVGKSRSLQRPNILILVYDSLSAQNMSLYGYPRRTTPHLDRFAGRCSVYHAHYTAGNFTTPATASILTGVYPWTHRAFNLGSVADREFETRNLFSAFGRLDYHRLGYSHNRLADFLLYRFRGEIDTYLPRYTYLLSNRQLLNRIFSGDRRIASMGEELAFIRKKQSSLFLSLVDKMFDPSLMVNELRKDFPRGLPEAFRAVFLLEQAIDGLIERLESAPQPFLGYFHFLPPHEPYRTRKEFKDRFEGGWEPEEKAAHFFSQKVSAEELNRLRRSYDEFLAYADAEFGRLVARMEQNKLLENTVIVFTADHGQLFERGIHGHVTPVLYEPVVRVPLLIYDPRRPYRQDIHTPTSCIDLLPTLLSMAGGKPPEWCEGVMMPPYQTGKPDRERSIFVLEAKQNARNRPLSTATVAVIKQHAKLISYYGYKGFDGEVELFELDRDQDERVNLAGVRKEMARAIRSELDRTLQGVNSHFARGT